MHDPIYLPEHALQVTENQISHDLTVINSFIDRSDPISPSDQAVLGMRLTLADADGYAGALLKAAVDAGLIRSGYRVCLLPKIAVDPCILCTGGIDCRSSATHKPRDFVLIAHEVGHYVFWRRPFTGDERDDNFLGTTAPGSPRRLTILLRFPHGSTAGGKRSSQMSAVVWLAGQLPHLRCWKCCVGYWLIAG